MTLAWLCAATVGAFDKRSEEVVGKVVAVDAERVGAAIAGSAVRVVVDTVAWTVSKFDVDTIEIDSCGFADNATDVLVD